MEVKTQKDPCAKVPGTKVLFRPFKTPKSDPNIKPIKKSYHVVNQPMWDKGHAKL